MKTEKGESKKINVKQFENAVILNCEKGKTTVNDVMSVINQALDQKRPVIIENINSVIGNN
jgi:hypothetical protein